MAAQIHLPLKLYHYPLSQPSRSVLLLLKAAHIEHDAIVVNLLEGEHKNQEYLDINPNGLVPTIVDGDFMLPESGAILVHIAESRHLTKFYPTDLVARAKINYWLHWNHNGARYSTLKILRPTEMGKVVTAEDRRHFEDAVAIIENQLMVNHQQHKGKFIIGTDTPTIADLLLIPELDQLTPEAFDLFDYSPYPYVTEYLYNVRASVDGYEEVFAPVVALANAMRKLKNSKK